MFGGQPFASISYGGILAAESISEPSFLLGFGYVLGLDVDTGIGIGKRSTASLGRDNDTNTGIGKRSTPPIGKDNDTNTGIGKKLH